MSLRKSEPIELLAVVNQPPDIDGEATVVCAAGDTMGILCRCNGETSPGDFNFGTLYLRLSPRDENFTNEEVIASPNVVLTAREIYLNNPVNVPRNWSSNSNPNLQASVPSGPDPLRNCLIAVQQLWRPVPRSPGRVEIKRTRHEVHFLGRRVDACPRVDSTTPGTKCDLEPVSDSETLGEPEGWRGTLKYVFSPSGTYEGVRLLGRDGNPLRAKKIAIWIEKCAWTCRAGDDSAKWGVPVPVEVHSSEGVAISPWISSCARFPDLPQYSMIVHQEDSNSTVVKDCRHGRMIVNLLESDIYLNVNFMLLFNLEFEGKIVIRIRTPES